MNGKYSSREVKRIKAENITIEEYESLKSRLKKNLIDIGYTSRRGWRLTRWNSQYKGANYRIIWASLLEILLNEERYVNWIMLP